MNIFNKENGVSIDRWIEVSAVVVLACFAGFTLHSNLQMARSTEQMVGETRLANKLGFRPYLVLMKSEIEGDVYYYDSEGRFRFPYQLKNTGNTAAIGVKKNHKVIKVFERGGQEKRSIPDDYKEQGRVFSVAPGDVSIIHPDILNLESPQSNVKYFLVEYVIEYKNDNSSDSRVFQASTVFKLKPIAITKNEYLFDDRVIEIVEKNERIISSSNDIKRLKPVARKTIDMSQAFNYFNSTYAQSIAALIALFGIFLIFRFEWENQKLFRTYNNAKEAVLTKDLMPHRACLDKDVKFYLFQHNYSHRNALGSRDVRMQIHYFEEVLHSMYRLVRVPIIFVAVLFLISLSSFAWGDYTETENYTNLAYYIILIIGLMIAFFWVYRRAHNLTRNPRDFTFNTLNPFQRYEDASKLDRGVFLHVTECIDLIERDILEFNKLPFKMNFAFQKEEKAIKNRKLRLGELREIEEKGYFALGENFLLKIKAGVPKDKEKNVNDLINSENRDRLRIIEYISSKYPEAKSVVPDLCKKIHDDIKNQLVAHSEAV